MKTTFSGSAPKNEAAASRAEYTRSAVFNESLWPLLPGFPPYRTFALTIDFETVSGFGYVVAALSK